MVLSNRSDHDVPVPGRHRQLQRTGLIVTAAAVAVVVVATGSWAGYREFSGKDCTSTATLKVTAAPEIAPAVRAAADTWAKGDEAKVDDACIAVTVVEAKAPSMAAAIAARHRVSLQGVGAQSEDSADSDVWVPDSATWLLRLASDAPGFVPSNTGSIASSPVVLAVPQPAAAEAGRTPGLKDVVKQIVTDKALRPGIVDPARDAAGLSALLALAAAAGNDAASGAVKVGIMRAFAVNSSSIRADMLQKFPRSQDDIGNSVGMAPLSEQDVITYNASRPPVSLAALYPQPAPPVLDYPFAVMPGIDPVKSAAATSLRRQLSTNTFHTELAKVGLRTPPGTTGPGFATPQGAPATVAPPPPSKDIKATATAIGKLLGSWSVITQPGRMLAVFDVSGSMKEKVPTAGGASRAQVMRQAAEQGLALLDDRWFVGNWTFSTNMVGKRPWIENCPIVSNATHHLELLACLDKITPKDGGDTGLYDTALASYKRVQEGWQAGLSNSVVLYTDGRNDNPDGGLTIDQLVAGLTKARDPKRPVRMIIIGIGPDVDRAELTTIAKASGNGGVFIATDPADMGDIILQAIGSRSGA